MSIQSCTRQIRKIGSLYNRSPTNCSHFSISIFCVYLIDIFSTQVVQSKYKGNETGLSFTEKIQESMVSLILPTEEESNWELTPLKSCMVYTTHHSHKQYIWFFYITQMQKKILDNYRPGKEIPYFALGMKLKDGATSTPLRAQIHFDGLEQPNFLTITRDPESPGQYRSNYSLYLLLPTYCAQKMDMQCHLPSLLTI